MMVQKEAVSNHYISVLLLLLPPPSPLSGLWALFFYRLSHSLYSLNIPLISLLIPRFTMSVVRYLTAVDIHPAAKLSGQ